jgi:heme-degrading monooxygenase HmoA
MILEVAILNLKPGTSEAFHNSFKKASSIIASQRGYLGHELKKCVEKEEKYILLVHWETIEDHEIGFRKSKDYQQWKALLHHYYEPFPVVEHYQ